MIRTRFIAALVTFVVTLGQTEEVKPKFMQLSERFYISTDQRPFVSAWIKCKTAGMQLASITSEDEQYEINNATKDLIRFEYDGYWIGAVAAERFNADKWYWIDSGLRMVYTNWGYGQPMEHYAYEYGYCVRLGSFYKENDPYKWENVDCNLRLYYVCELN